MLVLLERILSIKKWPTGSSPMWPRKRHREEFPCGFRRERIFSDLSKCGLYEAGVAEAAVDRLQ